MSISAVSPSVPMQPPEVSPPKPPEVKTDDDRKRTPQPIVLAALPPGQGTRINQLA